MELFQKECIGLIQAAFSGKPTALSPDFDWKRAIETAKNHNIAPILFYGASKCKISRDEEHMRELHRLTLQSAMVSLRQAHEIEQIEKVFEKGNIDYMPLKGSVLKAIYPKPEMRTMGDADILIRLEQYPKIEAIMNQLRFSYQYESDHELVWSKPSLFLELHKSIMTSYNKDFYRYFGSGWEIAHRVADTHRYEMTAEDFYIYIFVHFTKHYRISGIGIKHLIDLWVYANAHSELNWTYIENELKKMRLSQFHENVKKTIGVWFCGDGETPITDLITSVIFNSGQYGSTDMAIVNRALQNGHASALRIKFSRFFQNIFWPVDEMKKQYTVLNKVPILLPIMWIVRLFEVLFHEHISFKQYMKKINQIDSDQIRASKKALQVVGLDFHMEE